MDKLASNGYLIRKIANDFNPDNYMTVEDHHKLKNAEDIEGRSLVHGSAGMLSLGLAASEGSELFGDGPNAINKRKIKDAKKNNGLLGGAKATFKEFNPKGKGGLMKNIYKPLQLASVIGSLAYAPKAIMDSKKDKKEAEAIRQSVGRDIENRYNALTYNQQNKHNKLNV